MNDARINLTIPRDIHTAARVYAVQHGMTLAQVVAEALRRMLAPEQPKSKRP